MVTIPPHPLAGLLRALRKPQRHLDPRPRERGDLVGEGALVVERGNVVAAADALAVDHDVGDRLAACHLAELLLDVGAERVLVELDDEGRRVDDVLVEQDALGALRVGAVGLGEDDDWDRGQ